MSFVPTTYEEWKHCITVSCGIPLTQDYVQQRIADLNDASAFHTQRFIERWGEVHHKQTLEWFQQAAIELDTADG